MLQHYHIAACNLRPGFIYKFRRYKVVGAFNNNNAVIAFGKRNVRGAGSYAGHNLYVSGINAVRFKIFNYGTAVIVVADAANHINFGAEPCCGNCLVCPLAALGNNKAAAQNGFACQRTFRRFDNNVDIAAADNGDTNLCHMLHAPLTFKMLNLHTRNSVQYYYIGYSI